MSSLNGGLQPPWHRAFFLALLKIFPDNISISMRPFNLLSCESSYYGTVDWESDCSSSGPYGAQVPSPAWNSGLSTYHCCKCGVGLNCGSDSIPDPATSLCHKRRTKIKALRKIGPCKVKDGLWQSRAVSLGLGTALRKPAVGEGRGEAAQGCAWSLSFGSVPASQEEPALLPTRTCQGPHRPQEEVGLPWSLCAVGCQQHVCRWGWSVRDAPREEAFLCQGVLRWIEECGI